MRYVWIALAVVLADLLGGLAMAHGAPDSGFIIALGFLRLVIFGGAVTAANAALPSILSVTTALALLMPFIAVVPLLVIGRPLLMSFTLFSVGAQLLAGAALAEAAARFLYGTAAFLLQDAQGVLWLHIAPRHLALLAGFGVLIAAQLQRRAIAELPAPPLLTAAAPSFDLSGLLRGNDNVHIDVALSPEFRQAAHRLIDHFVVQHLTRLTGGERQEATPQQWPRQLQDSYAGMLRLAGTLEVTADPEARVRLLRLAVLGFLRERIRHAIAESIEERHHEEQGTRRRRAALPPPQERTWHLLARRAHVFHQVCRQVFILLDAQEQKLFGPRQGAASEQLPAALFSVPLLRAASAEDDEVLMEHYALLGHRRDDGHCFRRLDALLNRVFADIGEGEASPEALAGTPPAALPPSVLAAPDNVSRLLDVAATRTALREARVQDEPERTRELRAQLRYQRWQLARLRLALERAGLVPTLLAIYETPRLFVSYSGTYGPQLLSDLIRTPHNLLRTHRRLKMLTRRADDRAALRPIRQALRRVRRHSGRDVSDVLLRFVRDFSAYRRDLQLYLAVQQAVSEIRVLDDDNEIATSRLNRRLYDFPSQAETATSAMSLAGHVILKADLRGSTLITEELVRRRLNPATYFGRNFYDPITALTRHFEGEKVFIEGDAIILQFLEPLDAHAERLAVARACALAVRLIEVVTQNNERNAVYGLPPLEVGIGITYEPESPTYVFDGTTRIVISPAINRADRLSSCVRSLRRRLQTSGFRPHVAVFAVRDDAGEEGQQRTNLVYNVNGIALEAAAFEQLGKELPLRRVLDTAERGDEGMLYAVQWPQLQGKRRRLVVRRARIRALTEAVPQAGMAEDEYYHEVIADPQLLDTLERARLGGGPDGSVIPGLVAQP